jgi:peroxiredoxin
MLLAPSDGDYNWSKDMKPLGHACKALTTLVPFVLGTLLLGGCSKPIALEEGAAPNVELTYGVDARNLENTPRRSPVPVGKPVPNFWLPDQQGREVSARELVNGGDAILIFSPGDSAAESRAVYQWVEKNAHRFPPNTEVLIISPDSVELNAEIAKREGLKVALLSDRASYVARVYGLISDRKDSALKSTYTVVAGKENRIFTTKQGLPEWTELITILRVRPRGEDGGVINMLQ